MKLPKLAGAALMAALITNPAFARSEKVSAKPGVSTTIGYFAINEGSGKSCLFIVPKEYKVKNEPKHGKLSIKKINQTLTEGDCKGARVQGLQFIYRGNGKPDSVAISISGPKYSDGSGYRRWIQRYKINH